MKYVITESRLSKTITNYLDEIFDTENVHVTYPYEYDEETGEEGDDETRMKFYIGDYEDDNQCFYWYSEDYFDEGTKIKERAPIVVLNEKYLNILNGYFDKEWIQPFKEWFTYNFNEPVKTVHSIK